MSRQRSGGAFHASHAALVGRYEYRPVTDEWWWSDAMFRIHGFEPGEVVPTTELALRHTHPDDVEAAWDYRDAVVDRGEPFSFMHRIVTATKQVRVVIAAGHLEDRDGTPVVSGHLIDITDLRREAVDTELDTAVVDFVDHRAVIEQAKGVLVQLYSVDADTAWALLRAFSVDTNRKVRDIAKTLVAAAAADRTPGKPRPPSAHTVLEHLDQDRPEDSGVDASNG
ncbi:PAS and ANTAR domain-containing protein [Nocardioides pinisoli]|uniref:histidine kinase n=1 Tax=Nocardioides pinisoli TaxID=2950279 RepID=A0ABT1KRX7_9ACTN|nr:PAS and ANTAR domain-containing protein [Nocardioides pinisoli]MCP3420496.1 PAS and ANTAR domain-containing protein [Nocardioides pinisoli]